MILGTLFCCLVTLWLGSGSFGEAKCRKMSNIGIPETHLAKNIQSVHIHHHEYHHDHRYHHGHGDHSDHGDHGDQYDHRDHHDHHDRRDHHNHCDHCDHHDNQNHCDHCSRHDHHRCQPTCLLSSSGRLIRFICPSVWIKSASMTFTLTTVIIICW